MTQLNIQFILQFFSNKYTYYSLNIHGGRWRIRTNQELYQLCGENDIVKFCKFSRLRWAGHVIRQDDDDLSRRDLLSEPGGKRPRGRSRLHWEDGVKENAAKLGCRTWTLVAPNREEWRKLLIRRPRPTPGCSAVGNGNSLNMEMHNTRITFFLNFFLSFLLWIVIFSFLRSFFHVHIPKLLI